MKKVISINIRISKLSWAIIDENLNILESGEEKVNNLVKKSEELADSISVLLSNLDQSIKDVLIAYPGILDPKDSEIITNAIWLKPEKGNLKEVFKAHIENKNLYFESDSKAALRGYQALSEIKFNSAVYLTIRAGVSASVLLNGEVLYGNNSLLGNLGRLTFHDSKAEVLLSEINILSTATLFKSDEFLKEPELVELAKTDENFNDIIMNWYKNLVKLLSFTLIAYDPEVIVISSELIKYHEFTEDRIKQDLFALLNLGDSANIEIKIVENKAQSNIHTLVGLAVGYFN